MTGFGTSAWIPAFAGMTAGDAGMTVGDAGMTVVRIRVGAGAPTLRVRLLAC